MITGSKKTYLVAQCHALNCLPIIQLDSLIDWQKQKK